MAEKNKSVKKFKPVELAYIGISAAIIAVFSWISIPMSVPFTLQTLAVFLVLGIFGGKIGFFSVLTYILLGAIGLPVFSGFTGGLGHLLNTTGGYILGFLLMVAIYWAMTKLISQKFYIKITAMVLGLIVCYAFGTAWFMILYIKQNGAVTLLSVLSWCVFPFIVPDLAKMALAILLSTKLSKFVKS